MSKKRGTPEHIWRQETEKLETFIYENGLEKYAFQMSQYHFRIKTLKATIDIWAGPKKYFIKGTGSAATYKNPSELKKYLL